MEYRTLGKTGLTVSAIGLGAAEIGFEGSSQSQVSALIDQARAGGVTLIDTASAYLESEKLLGAALQPIRKEVVLVTKCGALEGFTRSDWSKEGILQTVRQSLANLRTEYVDVLLLHSCSEEELSRGEAIEGIEAARMAGYARHIGYSGDGAAAMWAARSGRFEVIETSLSILDQEALDKHLPVAAKAGLGVIIKRPLANAVWRYTTPPQDDYHTEYYRRWQKLGFPFAGASGAQIAAYALRFTVFQPGVHTAIIGTTKPARFAENCENLSAGPLDAATLQTLRTVWQKNADPQWTGQV